MPSYVPTKFYASGGKRLFKSKKTGKLFVRRPGGGRSYRSSGIQVSHMDTPAGKRVVRKHHRSVPYGMKPIAKYASPVRSAYNTMVGLFGRR
ncbi:hypothetical protein EBT25_02365 [bacterium]|nr:hypothetical protein [bacterium]